MDAHDAGLLSTLVVSLVFAFLGGAGARAVRLPPLVGYLLAGVAVGPFTPGFVADQRIASELAEIGVALLLFGIGLHFSIADLLAVRRIVLPGALLQVAATTGIGVVVARFVVGLPPSGSLILGLSLAIASTAVATRALEGSRSARRPSRTDRAGLVGGSGHRRRRGARHGAGGGTSQCERLRILRCARPGAAPDHRVRCSRPTGRASSYPMAAWESGPGRVARVVHPCCHRDRAWRCLRLGHLVRGLTRTRSLLCRGSSWRKRSQPLGSSRGITDPASLHRSLFCLGRNAVRPHEPHQVPAGDRSRSSHNRHRHGADHAADSPGAARTGGDGWNSGSSLRADRRVLLHSEWNCSWPWAPGPSRA